MSHHHGKDLRKGRFSEPGRIYLLTTVTKDRNKLFTNLNNSRAVINELLLSQTQGLCENIAWVVMPDHLHWLVSLQEGTLANLMKRMKSRSAIHLNRVRHSTAPVWQKGYHDHALRKEEDVKSVARYIVANPLRAGLVGNIGDYPYWDTAWL